MGFGLQNPLSENALLKSAYIYRTLDPFAFIRELFLNSKISGVFSLRPL